MRETPASVGLGGPKLERRIDQLAAEHRDRTYCQTSRLFAILMAVQWAAGVLIAVFKSPLTWTGWCPFGVRSGPSTLWRASSFDNQLGNRTCAVLVNAR